MWCCLRDPTFSRFDTIPACDTHAHTQTDRRTHDDGYHPRIACAARVKMRHVTGPHTQTDRQAHRETCNDGYYPSITSAAQVKIKKSPHISAAVQAISTKFGTISQFDLLDRSDHQKYEIPKIQDGGGRHLENSKDRHISAAVQAISTQFTPMTQFDLLHRSNC